MNNVDIVVCIGNTDNKLTQQEWADFVSRVGDELKKYEVARHFFGGSSAWEKWQNVLWLCVISSEDMDRLIAKLTHIRKDYHQAAIFFLSGDGILV